MDNVSIEQENKELRRLVNRLVNRNDHDYLAAQKETDNLSCELTAAQQRVAELESQYCDLMEAVKQSRRDHGDCQSGKRYGGKPLACTACMAQLKIDAMIAAYKGRRIGLA